MKSVLLFLFSPGVSLLFLSLSLSAFAAGENGFETAVQDEEAYFSGPMDAPLDQTSSEGYFRQNDKAPMSTSLGPEGRFVNDTSDIWRQIDLTSPRMKPAAPGIPWWAYAGGGAVAAGVGLAILIDSEDRTELIANDFQVQITCGRGGDIDPLFNDEGDDLELVDYDGPEQWLTQSGSILQVSPNANADFEVTYTVSDSRGNTAQARIVVRIVPPDIDIPDQDFEVDHGEVFTANIFDQFDCPGCVLFDVSTHSAIESLDFTPDGTVTIQFILDFYGPVNLTYTIADESGCRVSADLTIEVIIDFDPPVGNDVFVTVTCGEGGDLQPLENDEGDGLDIQSFDPARDWVTQEGAGFIISEEAYEDFEIQYTGISEQGLTYQATVFVEVIVPPLEIPNIEISATAGESITVDVFDHFDCTDCELTDVQFDPELGEVTFQEDGTIEINISTDFEGETQLEFFVRNPCMAESSGLLIIDVIGLECEDLEGLVTSADASCGLEDGAIYFDGSELNRTYEFQLDGEVVSDTVVSLAPGSYTFSVIDTQDPACSEDFPVEIGEGPFDLSPEAEIVAGSCIESGDIQISFDPGNYPLEGELLLLIETDFGDFEYEISDAEFSVLELIEDELEEEILTGEVTITIWVEGRESDCTFSETYEIPEEALPFELNDLVREVVLGQEGEFNYLELAAEGTGLTVVDYDEIPEVSLTMDEDGLASFVANEPGNYFSTVTVRDTCGQELSALLEFIVSDVTCVEYDVEIEIERSQCGMDNGFAIANVSPENPDLEYLWSNGETENFILDVPPGTYELTITDPATGCVDEFSIEIGEASTGDYLVSASVNPGNCVDPLTLTVNVQSPAGSAEMLVLAQGPDGQQMEAMVPVGSSLWSNIFDLSPGTWTFTITDPAVGPDCSQQFVGNLPQPNLPILNIGEIVHPSEPGASDGTIAISIANGTPPYTLLINGEFFDQINQPGNFVIPDLPAGSYEIGVIDDLGCESNIEVVVLEDPDGTPPLFKGLYYTSTAGSQSEILDGELLSNLEGLPELPTNLIPGRIFTFGMGWDVPNYPIGFSIRLGQMNGWLADDNSGFAVPFTASMTEPKIHFSFLPDVPGLRFTTGWRRNQMNLADTGTGAMDLIGNQFPTGLEWDYNPAGRFSASTYGQLLIRDDFSGVNDLEYGVKVNYRLE
jgi:hypothetical protein